MTDNKKDFLKNRYDPVQNRTIFYEDDSRLRSLLHLVNSADKPTIALDIGCYDGEIAKKIKEKIGKECTMYGIDIAENAAKEVQKKGIIFKTNDLNLGLDFPDNMFDFVFAGEIIEHIYDTDLFVSEIKRVLKPGGTLIITTPNLVSLGRRLCYLLGIGVFMEASLTFPKDPQPAGHIRFFTKKLLVDFMAHNNFELEKYVSDTVNFVRGFKSDLMARSFPTIGHALICRFRNKK